MNRVAIYLRQSLERECSVSREFQEADCRVHAERNGWLVAGVWSDVLSGRTPDRPQYQEMLEACNFWDILLVWRIDRVGRQELEFHRLLADLEARGKTFAAATEDVDDPLIRSIKIAVAADESRRIGMRVSRARLQRARDGFWPGTPPWGTRRTRDGLLEADPDRIWVVREVIERISRGQSFLAVARWMNSGPCNGSPVAVSTIRKWLRTPAFVGIVRWRGEETAARWQPLIDPDTWDLARRVSAERARWRPPVGWLAHTWIHGLAMCGLCGSRMGIRSAQRSRKHGVSPVYSYMHCNRYTKGDTRRGCEMSRSYPVRTIQAAVLEQLRAELGGLAPREFDRKLADVTARRSAEIRAAHDDQERTRAVLQARRGRIEEGFIASVFTASRASELIADVTRSLAALDGAPVAARPIQGDLELIRAALRTTDWFEMATTEPSVFRERFCALVERVKVPFDGSVASAVWRWDAP